SYERIHRSNLVGMGILPLQFEPGQNVDTLGLTGEELYTVESPIEGLAQRLSAGRRLIVTVEGADGSALRFPVVIRIDTPQEVLYYENGGILQYVLRQLLKV
ncbi:MAG: aconitate hydratase, partial [Isosphaeraceae bacterium]